MLEELKQRALEANLALPREGLVRLTSGNASQRDPESGLVAIKPSGVPYEALRREDMVLVDLWGRVVEGRLSPSSDTLAHLVIYRERPDVHGIVHTHSPYATAFALLGEPVPVYLTAMADYLGGPVPVAEYAPVGGEEMGRACLKAVGKEGRACLLAHHGVLTFGRDAAEAVRLAVVLEEVCRTVAVARSMGQARPLTAERVAAARERFVREYGQRPAEGG